MRPRQDSNLRPSAWKALGRWGVRGSSDLQAHTQTLAAPEDFGLFRDVQALVWVSHQWVKS